MLSDNPELTIIIVTYNTKSITEKCLESIIKSTKNTTLSYEVIIVDNASTDDTVTTIKAQYLNVANIRLIENHVNMGFAKANNIGANEARGKYILLLNSDTVVIDDAIGKLLEYFKSHDKSVHFLGAKLLNDDKSPQPSCGPFYSLPVIFGALFLRGDYWGLTRYSPDKTIETDWVSGACILTKREYFQKLGGFDEKIFMYMDEIDLLYRAKQSGYRVFFYPGARFIHLGSASSGGKTYPILQVYRGFLYFYQKHHTRFATKLLKILLKLKAQSAIILGRLINSRYLTQTYEQAYNLVKDSR